MGLWVLLLPLGYRMPYGFLVTLLLEIATLSIFYRAVARADSREALETLHIALVLCELGFHTAMVYFLGGISWLGPIAYLYALLYAVVFFSRVQAAIFAAMVSAAFVFIITVDAAGILPHQWYLPQDPDRYRDPHFLIPSGLGFVGVVSTVTFWMVFIGSELRREAETAMQANARLLKTQQELRALNDALERKVEERTRVLAYRAEHDQLTGLLNRGAIQHRCQDLLSLARRGSRPLAVVVADADSFKQCNDLAGHEYGDRVLKALALTLRDVCRETDLIGRTGGDEFLFVLPDTTESGAVRFCRRALRQLEERRKEWDAGEPRLPSVSMGVAVYPEHGSNLDELVRVADKAMYEAKSLGGGRCRVGESEDDLEVAGERRPEAV